jgi:hypothetical protein
LCQHAVAFDVLQEQRNAGVMCYRHLCARGRASQRNGSVSACGEQAASGDRVFEVGAHICWEHRDGDACLRELQTNQHLLLHNLRRRSAALDERDDIDGAACVCEAVAVVVFGFHFPV